MKDQYFKKFGSARYQEDPDLKLDPHSLLAIKHGFSIEISEGTPTDYDLDMVTEDNLPFPPPVSYHFEEEDKEFAVSLDAHIKIIDIRQEPALQHLTNYLKKVVALDEALCRKIGDGTYSSTDADLISMFYRVHAEHDEDFTHLDPFLAVIAKMSES